jgi:hypothetical protein
VALLLDALVLSLALWLLCVEPGIGLGWRIVCALLLGRVLAQWAAPLWRCAALAQYDALQQALLLSLDGGGGGGPDQGGGDGGGGEQSSMAQSSSSRSRGEMADASSAAMARGYSRGPAAEGLIAGRAGGVIGMGGMGGDDFALLQLVGGQQPTITLCGGRLKLSFLLLALLPVLSCGLVLSALLRVD